jgi:hypothetical protein
VLPEERLLEDEPVTVSPAAFDRAPELLEPVPELATVELATVVLSACVRLVLDVRVDLEPGADEVEEDMTVDF